MRITFNNPFRGAVIWLEVSFGKWYSNTPNHLACINKSLAGGFRIYNKFRFEYWLKLAQ